MFKIFDKEKLVLDHNKSNKTHRELEKLAVDNAELVTALIANKGRFVTNENLFNKHSECRYFIVSSRGYALLIEENGDAVKITAKMVAVVADELKFIGEYDIDGLVYGQHIGNEPIAKEVDGNYEFNEAFLELLGDYNNNSLYDRKIELLVDAENGIVFKPLDGGVSKSFFVIYRDNK